MHTRHSQMLFTCIMAQIAQAGKGGDVSVETCPQTATHGAGPGVGQRLWSKDHKLPQQSLYFLHHKIGRFIKNNRSAEAP